MSRTNWLTVTLGAALLLAPVAVSRADGLTTIAPRYGGYSGYSGYYGSSYGRGSSSLYPRSYGGFGYGFTYPHSPTYVRGYPGFTSQYESLRAQTRAATYNGR